MMKTIVRVRKVMIHSISLILSRQDKRHIKIYTPKVVTKTKGHEITDEKINPYKNELFDELTNNKASDAEDKEIEIDENNEVNVNQIMRMKKNKFQQLWEINEFFNKNVSKSYEKLEEAKDQLDVAVRDYNYKMNTIQNKINDIADAVFKNFK